MFRVRCSAPGGRARDHRRRERSVSGRLTGPADRPYAPGRVALSEERLCSIIEAILVVSADPVPVGRIVEVIRIEDPDTEEGTIRNAVASLVASYQDVDRAAAFGFRVEEVAGGIQLRTAPENAPFVRRFLAARPQRLSRASLETLSIIAYRQPATKPEIEAIRGVDVGAALKHLLDRDLIRILGKKDEIGRPIIYGTTPFFLEFFGLKNLGELPTLREYRELDDEHQKEVDALDEELSVRQLAEAAQFLSQREHDPDLDALDDAVRRADVVRKEAKDVLSPEADSEASPSEAVPSEAVPSEAVRKPARRKPARRKPARRKPARRKPSRPNPVPRRPRPELRRRMKAGPESCRRCACRLPCHERGWLPGGPRSA